MAWASMRARMTARPRLRLAFSTHSSRVCAPSPTYTPKQAEGTPIDSGTLQSVEPEEMHGSVPA